MDFKNQIPKDLPEIRGNHEIDIEQVLEELPKAKNRFIFYETEDGEGRLLFDNIGAVLYACLVAKLSHPVYQKVYEFFRFVLEGVNQAKKQTKKGLALAGKIESYLKNW